jgi:hypothetical protein
MKEIDKIKFKIDQLIIEQEEQINGHFANLIEAYIKESYNLGLQDAADNVALNSTEEYNERKGEYYREYFVDKESILKLKL